MKIKVYNRYEILKGKTDSKRGRMKELISSVSGPHTVRDINRIVNPLERIITNYKINVSKMSFEELKNLNKISNRVLKTMKKFK
jgi:pantothenate kinase